MYTNQIKNDINDKIGINPPKKNKKFKQHQNRTNKIDMNLLQKM